jgi:hypothetical protein
MLIHVNRSGSLTKRTNENGYTALSLDYSDGVLEASMRSTGMALSKETVGKLTNLVWNKRPDLMLLTDDVYGTFVDDFRSVLGELPHNTCEPA